MVIFTPMESSSSPFGKHFPDTLSRPLALTTLVTEDDILGVQRSFVGGGETCGSAANFFSSSTSPSSCYRHGSHAPKAPNICGVGDRFRQGSPLQFSSEGFTRKKYSILPAASEEGGTSSAAIHNADRLADFPLFLAFKNMNFTIFFQLLLFGEDPFKVDGPTRKTLLHLYYNILHNPCFASNVPESYSLWSAASVKLNRIVGHSSFRDSVCSWGTGSKFQLGYVVNSDKVHDMYLPKFVFMPSRTITGATGLLNNTKNDKRRKDAHTPPVSGSTQPPQINEAESFFSSEEVLSVSCGKHTSFLATADGNVIVWGSGSKGLLGTGNDDTVLSPALLPDFGEHGIGSVKQVAAGGDNTVFLLQQEMPLVYSLVACGPGTPQIGALRVAKKAEQSSVDEVSKMTGNSTFVAFNTLNVEGAAAPSKVDSGVISKSKLERPYSGQNAGDLFYLKVSSDQYLGPTLRVSSVSAGELHSMLLTEQGHVFAWGCNGCGQCGLGSRILFSKSPQRCDSLRSIKSINAYGNVSGALTFNGDAFIWGGYTEDLSKEVEGMSEKDVSLRQQQFFLPSKVKVSKAASQLASLRPRRANSFSTDSRLNDWILALLDYCPASERPHTADETKATIEDARNDFNADRSVDDMAAEPFQELFSHPSKSGMSLKVLALSDEIGIGISSESKSLYMWAMNSRPAYSYIALDVEDAKDCCIGNGSIYCVTDEGFLYVAKLFAGKDPSFPQASLPGNPNNLGIMEVEKLPGAVSYDDNSNGGGPLKNSKVIGTPLTSKVAPLPQKGTQVPRPSITHTTASKSHIKNGYTDFYGPNCHQLQTGSSPMPSSSGNSLVNSDFSHNSHDNSRGMSLSPKGLKDSVRSSSGKPITGVKVEPALPPLPRFKLSNAVASVTRVSCGQEHTVAVCRFIFPHSFPVFKEGSDEVFAPPICSNGKDVCSSSDFFSHGSSFPSYPQKLCIMNLQDPQEERLYEVEFTESHGAVIKAANSPAASSFANLYLDSSADNSDDLSSTGLGFCRGKEMAAFQALNSVLAGYTDNSMHIHTEGEFYLNQASYASSGVEKNRVAHFRKNDKLIAPGAAGSEAVDPASLVDNTSSSPPSLSDTEGKEESYNDDLHNPFISSDFKLGRMTRSSSLTSTNHDDEGFRSSNCCRYCGNLQKERLEEETSLSERGVSRTIPSLKFLCQKKLSELLTPLNIVNIINYAVATFSFELFDYAIVVIAMNLNIFLSACLLNVFFKLPEIAILGIELLFRARSPSLAIRLRNAFIADTFSSKFSPIEDNFIVKSLVSDATTLDITAALHAPAEENQSIEERKGSGDDRYSKTGFSVAPLGTLIGQGGFLECFSAPTPQFCTSPEVFTGTDKTEGSLLGMDVSDDFDVTASPASYSSKMYHVSKKNLLQEYPKAAYISFVRFLRPGNPCMRSKEYNQYILALLGGVDNTQNAKFAAGIQRSGVGSTSKEPKQKPGGGKKNNKKSSKNLQPQPAHPHVNMKIKDCHGRQDRESIMPDEDATDCEREVNSQEVVGRSAVENEIFHSQKKIHNNSDSASFSKESECLLLEIGKIASAGGSPWGLTIVKNPSVPSTDIGPMTSGSGTATLATSRATESDSSEGNRLNGSCYPSLPSQVKVNSLSESVKTHLVRPRPIKEQPKDLSLRGPTASSKEENTLHCIPGLPDEDDKKREFNGKDYICLHTKPPGTTPLSRESSPHLVDKSEEHHRITEEIFSDSKFDGGLLPSCIAGSNNIGSSVLNDFMQFPEIGGLSNEAKVPKAETLPQKTSRSSRVKLKFVALPENSPSTSKKFELSAPTSASSLEASKHTEHQPKKWMNAPCNAFSSLQRNGEHVRDIEPDGAERHTNKERYAPASSDFSSIMKEQQDEMQPRESRKTSVLPAGNHEKFQRYSSTKQVMGATAHTVDYNTWNSRDPKNLIYKSSLKKDERNSSGFPATHTWGTKFSVKINPTVNTRGGRGCMRTDYVRKEHNYTLSDIIEEQREEQELREALYLINLCEAREATQSSSKGKQGRRR